MTSETITWQNFGTYLHSIRQRHALTQKRLAEQIGCTQNHLWRLESGSRHPSKLLLLLLRSRFPPTPEEAKLLCAFEQLIEYKLEQITIDAN